MCPKALLLRRQQIGKKGQSFYYHNTNTSQLQSSSSPNTVQDSRKSRSASQFQCVCLYLSELNEQPHSRSLYPHLPLSGFPIILLSFYTSPPTICAGPLFVLVVCSRLHLLCKRAPFSRVRFCHFVKAPVLTRKQLTSNRLKHIICVTLKKL